MSTGASVARFCANIGISRGTFYDWCDRYESMREAFAKASTLAEAVWLDKAEENLSNPNFNSSMYNFQLSTRFGLSKGRRIRTKSFNDKKKSLLEQFAETLKMFENNDISLDEFNGLVDAFMKLATIKEKVEIEERVALIEKNLREQNEHVEGQLSDQNQRD